MKFRLRRFLRARNGDAAVEFVMTAAMLILLVAVLITTLLYVTKYYTASYICRRVVRTIEVTGEYNEASMRCRSRFCSPVCCIGGASRFGWSAWR